MKSEVFLCQAVSKSNRLKVFGKSERLFFLFSILIHTLDLGDHRLCCDLDLKGQYCIVFIFLQEGGGGGKTSCVICIFFLH